LSPPWLETSPLGVGLASGQVATFTMSINNTGGQTLNWSLIEPAFWLFPSPSSGSIPPGSSANVALVFVGPATTVTFSDSTVLTIYSNDPARPVMLVNITALFSPRQVFLPGVLKNR
jgi:hypothetical protein